jgi:hypothetical protein
MKLKPLRPLLSMSVLGLFYLFPGLVFAQASDQIAASSGLSNELAGIIVASIVVPTVGAFTKYWIDNKARAYADQWTAVNDSKAQLVSDKDKLIAAIAAKDAEIDRLETELRAKYETIADLKSDLKYYKRRLAVHEPVTGETKKDS